MLAFSYDRVSTSRQADRTDLEVRYAEVIKAYCQRRGWTLAGAFCDAGLSGKDANRPGLKRAIAAAVEHGGVIVFYDLSRFSRSINDLLEIADYLGKRGASLSSATEAIDTSDDNPAAQLTFHLLAAVAQFQRKLTGAKVKEANRRRVKEVGYRTQGTSPAGTRIVDGVRVVCSEERDVIRLVRELRTNGMTAAKAAERLNLAEIPTIRKLRGYKRAGAWTAGAVRHLERNRCTHTRKKQAGSSSPPKTAGLIYQGINV